jgi:hypothetical protein
MNADAYPTPGPRFEADACGASQATGRLGRP